MIAMGVDAQKRVHMEVALDEASRHLAQRRRSRRDLSRRRPPFRAGTRRARLRAEVGRPFSGRCDVRLAATAVVPRI